MAAVSRGVQSAAEAQLAHMARSGGGNAGAAPLPPLPSLPPPMVTGNYEANATSCHLQAGAGQAVTNERMVSLRLSACSALHGAWQRVRRGRRWA